MKINGSGRAQNGEALEAALRSRVERRPHDAHQRDRDAALDGVEDDVRHVGGECSVLRSGADETLQFIEQIVGEAIEFAAPDQVEDALQIDAVDENRRIASIRLPLVDSGPVPPMMPSRFTLPRWRSRRS